MKNEINPKTQQFLEKYKALVDEMQMDFATYPVFTPDGQGGFKVIIQNTPVELPAREEKKEEGVPSPFVPEK